MEAKLYYIAPSDATFEEMKKACIEQWSTHDNTHGYVEEKVNRIKDIKNVQDNFVYMFAMFSIDGQQGLVRRLSDDTKNDLRARLVDGGNEEWYIKQMGL